MRTTTRPSAMACEGQVLRLANPAGTKSSPWSTSTQTVRESGFAAFTSSSIEGISATNDQSGSGPLTSSPATSGPPGKGPIGPSRMRANSA